MTSDLPILCIGSALWDIIARAAHPMQHGSDVPGRIERQLGGVALNVALALAAQGQRPTLLTALGRDADGDGLVAAAEARGVDCRFVTRTDDPTDSYLAIEDPRGEVFGAVADCASLERAGAAILEPLRDGRLADPARPFAGTVVIDGNLPTALLTMLAADPMFRAARLAFVPASPGKADRLRAVIRARGGTIYVNRGEAEILCLSEFPNARAAAEALVERGAERAVVTNGARKAAVASRGGAVTLKPPKVETRSLTGAGDVFLAAHLVADARGASPEEALAAAVAASAAHICRSA